MNMLKNKKGFTLIEMLVVIAIIAVLVAIVVPTVSSSTAKAKAATDAANLRTAMGEAQVYLLSEDTAKPSTDVVLTTSQVKSVGTVCKQDGTSKLTITLKTDGSIVADFRATDGSVKFTLDQCITNAGGNAPAAE